MSINFSSNSSTVCPNIDNLVFSIYQCYTEDDLFKNNIDDFFNEFNSENNTQLSFKDIINIHRNIIKDIDSQKAEMLIKALEELKNNTTFNLKYNNFEVSFSDLSNNIINNIVDEINNVVDKNFTNIDAIIENYIGQIKLIIIEFINSINEKLNKIISSSGVKNNFDINTEFTVENTEFTELTEQDKELTEQDKELIDAYNEVIELDNTNLEPDNTVIASIEQDVDINQFNLDKFINNSKGLTSENLIINLSLLSKEDFVIFLKGFLEYSRINNTSLSKTEMPALTEIFCGTSDFNNKEYKNTYNSIYNVFKLKANFSKKKIKQYIDLFQQYINLVNLEKILVSNAEQDITKFLTEQVAINYPENNINNKPEQKDIEPDNIPEQEDVSPNDIILDTTEFDTETSEKDSSEKKGERLKRMQNLKGFLIFMNDIIDKRGRKIHKSDWDSFKRYAQFTLSNFSGNATTVSPNMFNLVNDITIKSDRFVSIFQIVPMEKFPQFIEEFLSGANTCSANRINQIMMTKNPHNTNISKKKINLDSNNKSIPTEFTHRGITYSTKSFPYSQLDEERWLNFIGDIKSNQVKQHILVETVFNYARGKQVGSDIKNKSRSNFEGKVKKVKNVKNK